MSEPGVIEAKLAVRRIRARLGVLAAPNEADLAIVEGWLDAFGMAPVPRDVERDLRLERALRNVCDGCRESIEAVMEEG